MPTNIAQQKRQIRQQIIQQRKNLTQTQLTTSAAACCKQVIQSRLLETAETVALYLQHIGEINPHPLIEVLWEQGKRTYLPVIGKDNNLTFVRYVKGGDLRLNQYGIAEPTSTETCSLANLDVICMPLVAFDSAGNRIGMGGGYYDRTLAKRTSNSALITVGLAYQFQKVAKIPTTDWDQTMDWVVTDQKIYQA
jgi:5-formyltetrahydrofolate cyclo-ligase